MGYTLAVGKAAWMAAGRPTAERTPWSRRRALGQSFVGSHLVVLVAEAVEAHLLLTAGGRWRVCRNGLQHAGDALVLPVLLSIAALDPLQDDAQYQPPRRQLAQAVGPGLSGRTAVVATQALGQAVRRPSQRVAAVRVHDRQRVQPLPVRCLALTLATHQLGPYRREPLDVSRWRCLDASGIC